MPQTSYALKPQSLLITETPFYGDVLLQDAADDNAHALMQRYFTHGYEIFSARLAELKRMERPLTNQEERELRFMLDALISAKRSLE